MDAEPVTGRRMRIGLAAVATLLLSSACAAGQLAQTTDQKATLDGVNTSVGSIDLRGLAIQAPTAAPYYLAGTSPALTVVIINSGTTDDALTSITTSAASSWGTFASLTEAQTAQSAAASAAESAASSPASAGSSSGAATSSASSGPAVPQGTKSVTIPAGQRVGYGVPSSTGALLLLTIKDRLYPGTTVRMTFTFARAGTITILVPVQLTGNPGTAEVGAASDSPSA